MPKYITQNDLLLKKLKTFYIKDNFENLDKILPIINGNSHLSIRIIDWFVTNYAKKYYVVYNIKKNNEIKRFKVHNEYELFRKSYRKRRFDPFCRFERVNIPYKNDTYIQTTIGQLKFFKWILENNVFDYIEKHYENIQKDMNIRNTTCKNKITMNKTRKRRQELSVSAIKSVKKEDVEIIVKFD